MLNIEKAIWIDGWMDRTDLTWLASRACEHDKIVELGSYLGRSTRALGDHTPGFVLAIDTWQNVGQPEEPLHGEAPFIPQDQLLTTFKRNCADLIAAKKVKILELDHSRLTNASLDFKPNFIFIDGSHDKEAVYRDVAWAKLVAAPQALIAGHDIDMKTVQQGLFYHFKVIKAVQNTRIWYVLL